MSARVLVVDNYDSFVFTIVGYLAQLGADCEVVRNDAVRPADAAGFDGVLLSPGPGTPEDAGVCVDMVRACAEREQPLLGVCLGHQALGVAYGATVDRAPELLHGKTSEVLHEGGHRLLANWLATCGDTGAVERSQGMAPLVRG